VPDAADRLSIARTATGRVLYATRPSAYGALPDCWTTREWRQLRVSLRDTRATVTDHQDAFPGICCLSAPVWWPNGTCAGAVTAMVAEKKPARNLPDLVLHAAKRIGAGLH
jgi:DNA-binding IclR family transcriptional regulator